MKPACHFCGAKSAGVCGWKYWHWVVVPVSELIVGERVRRWSEEAPRSGKVATLVAILATMALPGRAAKLTGSPTQSMVELEIGKPDGPKSMRRYWIQFAKADRFVPCGLPACKACSANRMGGARACREHWHAWEKVA